MKTLFIIFAALLLKPSFLQAQLLATPVCPAFVVDILAGSVNKLSPKSTIGEIQKTFPCATDVVEADSALCSGIFYKDRDIFFYTDRDYIQVGETFKGKITPSLLGVPRSSLFALLGNPKIKDPNWEAFQMQYGTLVLYYKEGKVNKIQFSSRNAETLKLCP